MEQLTISSRNSISDVWQGSDAYKTSHIKNQALFNLLKSFSNLTKWECHCKELLEQSNLCKRTTLVATHSGCFEQVVVLWNTSNRWPLMKVIVSGRFLSIPCSKLIWLADFLTVIVLTLLVTLEVIKYNCRD